MVAAVIVVAEEFADHLLERIRKIGVFQQDAVLERLVPPLGLALGLPDALQLRSANQIAR